MLALMFSSDINKHEIVVMYLLIYTMHYYIYNVLITLTNILTQKKNLIFICSRNLSTTPVPSIRVSFPCSNIIRLWATGHLHLQLWPLS